MARSANRFLGSRRALSVAALICIAVLLVSVNVIAGKFLPYRLDLTSQHLYTLSRGTRDTLSKIDEPITLRFYYSTKLGDSVPAYGVYAQRVRELLDQYVAAAKGKIQLEVYNPQPFSDVEDRAVALGLQGAPLNEQGDQVYFGLAATNSTDDQQVIPFFSPQRERFLEYDFTKLVHALAFPRKIGVGLMSSLPLDGDPMAAMQGRPSKPAAIVEQLQQLDDVEPLSTTVDAIPGDIDVLMLVHPQNLPPKTLYAIDQFVLRGGKAVVFVDPYSELQGAAMPATGHGGGAPATASNLDLLFQRWGLRLLPNVVAGDRRNARRVAAPVAGRGTQAVDYIGWLSLGEANLNRDDVITADLGQVTMASAGILEPLPGASTQLVPLITTSSESTKIPVDKVRGLPDVAALLAGFHPDNQHYILAARVTGPIDTAFPDGPPKEPPPGDAKPDAKPDDAKAAATPPASPPQPAAAGPEPLKHSAKPINVVVVADTDMLDDRFWAQGQDFFGQHVIVPTANNGDFVANAIEVLAGGEDLVDLRSRGSSARPFELVNRIQRAADDRYAAEQQSLEQKLKEAQTKLRTLTGGEAGNGNAPLSAEQTKAIDDFRTDMLKTRQQLRAVQSALRQDIGWLQTMIEFADIALIPLIVAAAALVLAALRLNRRRHRRPALA